MKVIEIIPPQKTKPLLKVELRKGEKDSAWTESFMVDGLTVKKELGITTGALLDILGRFREAHCSVVMFIEMSRTFERRSHL